VCEANELLDGDALTDGGVPPANDAYEAIREELPTAHLLRDLAVDADRDV
jgi:hypothetical protein